MSHFYGRIPVSSRSGIPTACATKKTGLAVEALTWEGRVRIDLFWNEEIEVNEYVVTLYDNTGETELARGVIK